MIEELYFIKEVNDTTVNNNNLHDNSINDSFNESIIINKDSLNLNNIPNDPIVEINAINPPTNNHIHNLTSNHQNLLKKISNSSSTQNITSNLNNHNAIKFNFSNPHPTPTTMQNNINTCDTLSNINKSNVPSSLTENPIFKDPIITIDKSTIIDTTGSFFGVMAASLTLCICPCYIRKIRNLIEYEYMIVNKTSTNYKTNCENRYIKRLNALNLSIINQITQDKLQFELKRHPNKLRLQQG